MCRNIRKLRCDDRPPTDSELRDAALQFVRKISGYSKPSKLNAAAFEAAVDEITDVSRRMFDNLPIKLTAPVPVESPATE